MKEKFKEFFENNGVINCIRAAYVNYTTDLVSLVNHYTRKTGLAFKVFTALKLLLFIVAISISASIATTPAKFWLILVGTVIILDLLWCLAEFGLVRILFRNEYTFFDILMKNQRFCARFEDIETPIPENEYCYNKEKIQEAQEAESNKNKKDSSIIKKKRSNGNVENEKYHYDADPKVAYTSISEPRED